MFLSIRKGKYDIAGFSICRTSVQPPYILHSLKTKYIWRSIKNMHCTN